jgi:anti-anti-sigma factor
MTPFEYTITALPDGHLVRVCGELDLATAPDLADILDQIVDGTIKLDISGVTFLDSSGLRTLLVANRDLERCGRRMIVCGPIDPVVQRTLAITQVDGVLEFDERPPRRVPTADARR